MGYINGLRSFGYKSELAASRSKSKKRESTSKWMGALVRAERAHWLYRKAAELGQENKYKEAEESAIKGIKVSRNPTAGASIGEPRALAYTSRTAYVSYA